MAATSLNEHRDTLLQAFGIEAGDLEANRSGRLGARQSALLVRSGVRNFLAALLCGVALAAILMFVVHKPLKPGQWITALILFLIVFAIGVNDMMRTRAAAAEGKVDTLSGPVKVQRQGKQGFRLIVAGQNYPVPVHFWHIQDGGNYRVYVVTRARRIVAMEPDPSPT
jgi:hypothetical protein